MSRVPRGFLSLVWGFLRNSCVWCEPSNLRCVLDFIKPRLVPFRDESESLNRDAHGTRLGLYRVGYLYRVG